MSGTEAVSASSAALVRGAGRGRVVLDLDVLDVVGVARRRDVVGDVGRFLVRLGRLDLEGLHDAGPDHAEQDRREHEQRQAHRGQRPGASPDVEEEQHRTDHGDAEQDVLGRQHRMVVGVGDAGDQVARGVDDVVAVEPVVSRLGQHEQAEQHRELHLRGAGQPVARDLQPDAAVEVVHRGRRQDREHEQGHREVDEVVQPGQLEDVPADVLAEEPVGLVEGHPVGPQEIGTPLPCGRGAGEEADDDGDAGDQPAADGQHGVAVALEARLLGRVRAEERPEAVGEVHVGPDGSRPSAGRRPRTARSGSRTGG